MPAFGLVIPAVRRHRDKLVPTCCLLFFGEQQARVRTVCRVEGCDVVHRVVRRDLLRVFIDFPDKLLARLVLRR